MKSWVLTQTAPHNGHIALTKHGENQGYLRESSWCSP